MYDLLIITHLPSFYKINLYNELAKHLKIFVIFAGSKSKIRTPDFIGTQLNFTYTVLHNGDFESRPPLITIVKLSKLIITTKYKIMAVGGWDLLEFWIAILLSKKKSNAVIMESTANDRPLSYLKKLLKLFFVSRLSISFPSGKLHLQYLQSHKFTGVAFITKGVGIFNRNGGWKPPVINPTKFLYVGRLSSEKNLLLLLEAFSDLPDLTLSIVGSGPMELQLKSIAPLNVTFISHVPNNAVGQIYCNHDIFILPSLSEPWGLVVDEALHYGLPVIASKNVGSHTELIEDGINGLLFDPLNLKDLKSKIELLSQNSKYQEMIQNIRKIDFSRRDKEQIHAYILAIIHKSNKINKSTQTI